MRKFYLIIAPFLLLLIAGSAIYSYFADSNSPVIPFVLMPAWGVLIMLTLITLFKNGVFRKTLWCRFAAVGAGIALIGFALELKEKIDGKVTLLAGVGIFVLSYLLFFVNKPAKKILDWFKAGYIITIPVVLAVAMWGDGRYTGAVHTASILIGLSTICQHYVHLAKYRKPIDVELTREGDRLFHYNDE